MKKILFVYYKLFNPGGINRVLVSLVNNLVEEYDVTILLLNKEHDPFYELDSRVKLIFIDTFSHWAFQKGCVGINKYLSFIPRKQNIKNYLYDYGAHQMTGKWLNANHHEYETIVTCMYKLSIGASMNKDYAHKTIGWEHTQPGGRGFLWSRLRKDNYHRLKNVVVTNEPSRLVFSDLNDSTVKIYNFMSREIELMPFYDLASKKKLIVLIASFSHEKNIPEFIEILSKIDFKDLWEVKIMGDGPYKKDIEQAILKFKLSDHVHLLEAGTIDDVYQLFKESNIKCLTSIAEALPTVLIEAMACSNVLIAYDCKDGPRDIINAKNGFLIEQGDIRGFRDKLQLLIDDAQLLEKLNKSSFEEAKKWKNSYLIYGWKSIL